MFFISNNVLVVTLIFGIISVIEAGKQKGRKTRSLSLSTPVVVEDYQAKSLAERSAMSLEILHLACNALHITLTGPRYVVADRLIQFFNPPASADGMEDLNETIVEGPAERVTLSLSANSIITGTNVGMTSEPVPQQHISTMIREEVQLALGDILTTNSHILATVSINGYTDELI